VGGICTCVCNDVLVRKCASKTDHDKFRVGCAQCNEEHSGKIVCIGVVVVVCVWVDVGAWVCVCVCAGVCVLVRVVWCVVVL